MSKIAFYLMTEKGFEVLRRAISVNRQGISQVVVGRDANLTDDFSRELEMLCKDNEIDCYSRGEEPRVPDDEYVFAVSWRWMIEHPSKRLIVFHDSLLPKYRGFSPLVNMLINGEQKIGVSALFGSENYDRGEVIAQRHIGITYPIKISEAIRINTSIYSDLAAELMLRISASEDLVGTPQNDAEASYSIWRDADDYFIDWSQNASDIKRFVDAVGAPYAGARSLTSGGAEVVIEEVAEVEDVACELRHAGKVLFVEDGRPTIICGSGLLRIEKASVVTPEGPVGFLPISNFRIRFR